MKTWFLVDLICSIPIYTLLNSLETKCPKNNNYIGFNSENHSHFYDIHLDKKQYILLLIKVIKILKIFGKNIAALKLKDIFIEVEFLYYWGDVFIYSFFFLSFLNLFSCMFIFLGRNIIDSWIFIDNFQEKSFLDIYIGSVYYLIMTVTTVGYGDIIGSSINEIIFQIVMVIAGTCIYSWIISSVSNYVKKMNEKYIKYEEKIQVLEEIRINNPHMTEKLYNKILRLINYRKYHEEENEKNIILESIPNSLKNALIIEMYKTYINGFSFFKDIENREFKVKIISKLTPLNGIKGDILIQEGEKIEEIIFIKSGILSLEIWLDMTSPEESIQNYLNKNGFISQKFPYDTLLKLSLKSNKSSIIQSNSNNKKTNFNFNNYIFEKIYNKNEEVSNENNKIKLKILEIRKNEHFGDVFMFLNKKSPLYVKVNSRKADLLLLKKLDIFSISDRYPDIWKTIIKKPLENSKIIANLTLKALTTFCNLNGIKTKIFKKKRYNIYFPNYYLIPIINKRKNNLIKIQTKNNINKLINNNIEENNKEKEESDINGKSNNKIYNLDYQTEIDKKSGNDIQFKKAKENNYLDNSIISFNNKTKKSNFVKNIKNDGNDLQNNNNIKEKGGALKSLFSNKRNSFGINTKEVKSSNNSILEKENKNIKFNKSNINDNKKYFSSESINDEILPGENFDIHIYEDEKPKNINNIFNSQKVFKEKIFINNLNIYGLNYKEIPLMKKYNNNFIQKSKNIFNNLNISSTSCFEIRASYENINTISLNKYISDDNLREETKHFLQEKCNIIQSKKENDNDFNKVLTNQHSENNNSNTSILQSKTLLLNNISDQRFINKSSIQIKDYSFLKKPYNNKIKNSATKKLFSKKDKNIIMKNSTINFKFKKFYENKNNPEEIKRTNTSKSYMKNNFNISEPKQFFQIQKGTTSERQNFQFKNKNNQSKLKYKDKNRPNTKNKKKKKLNELDIISSNIFNTSLNLNQPDTFYAGLFNQLIIKDNMKLKGSKLKESKLKSENNNDFIE